MKSYLTAPLAGAVLALAVVLGSPLTASAAEGKVWVPPPPVGPAVPLHEEDEGPDMSQLRTLGGVHLLWTKGLQTALLSMLVTQAVSEGTGRDSSKLLLPETILVWGHSAAFVIGPWGYALAIDDGRPHRRHLGLGIGLAEQAIYSMVSATLNVVARDMFYERNGCHIPDERGCVDHFYGPASEWVGVVLYITGGIMAGCAAMHLSFAGRLKQLEGTGILDGPAGDPYRQSRAKPTALVLPWSDGHGGGLALVGQF